MLDLIGQAKCVLFGFDGPLCRLFPYRGAEAVTERLRALLPPGLRQPGGYPGGGDERPWQVLRTAATSEASAVDGVVQDVEQALAREELAAASAAFPTAYADSLARTLRATGRCLAVTTDTSQQAVEHYLAARLTGDLFAGHIHGRAGDPKLLTPDPHSLLRALESTGTAAHDAVLIGASPRDLAAARSAGVGFIGYGRGERESAALREAGAEHVVDSLRTVLVTVDPGAHV
jgi:phosphoglycolate phosphatase-like HAD superfamily hydrolase